MRRHILLFFPFVLCMAGCVNGQSAAFRPAKINHLVFFSLASPDDRVELIADCDEQLATIDGVVSYWCGEHGDFGRSIVDSNYDVGFYVGFNTRAKYEQYLKHPSHIAVVEKWKPRWNWIKIYDTVDETP